MSQLDTMLEEFPLPTGRLAAWIVMALLALTLVWSRFAYLDEVAVAEGEVVPKGQVKVVQHLEGGIIREIYVTEGTVVAADQPVLQLDLATTAMNAEEITVKLDGLMLQKARLEAEAHNQALSFPKEEAARQPALLEAERKTFDARRREHEQTVSVLERQLAQKESEVRELDTKRSAAANNLRLLRQRVEMSANLLKEGLTPKMDHLHLEGEAQQHAGELATVEQSLPRVRAALAEVRDRIEESRLSFRRNALDQLGQIELNIAFNKGQLAKATGQRERTQIRSPIAGVVKNMRYHTIGGVVQPGEAVMEIVPTDDNVVVEARLSPTDRGYVEVGQPAMVKISSYDFSRFGGLEGKVILVAPDSTVSEKGEPHFRVVVQTDKTWLGDRKGDLPITPGMQATVDIHTGSKTVLDYLLKPVLKVRDEAFRER